jgi:putative membrane protein
MDYMFGEGFLGTRAPLFMDFVTLIVALLPFLVMGAIILSRKKSYAMHALAQKIILVTSVIVVGYFEYGVRLGGGFTTFVEGTSVSYDYALYVLLFHIAIAVITLALWVMTMYKAHKAFSANSLPGSFSLSHKKFGMATFTGIVLTSLTGIWVYMLLFIF